MVVKVTEDTFEQEVLKSELPVLLDCYADWCGPCKMMSPVVDKMADVFAGKLKVCKLNVDEDGGAVMEYRIMSIPNFLFFKNGEVVKNVVGDAAQHKFDHGNQRFPISLISLGLAGSGTNKNSSPRLEFLKYRPLDDALLKQ